MFLLSYTTAFLAVFCLFLLLFILFHSYFVILNFTIFSLFSLNLSISFMLDWVSLCFSFTVLSISSAILVYSNSYIPMKEHKQFALILLCFISSMITLIFSNNMFFLMLGWDGLGLSSYILVIYYQNYKSKESGALTILTNRVGDIFIILSISTMVLSGSWEFFMNKEFPWPILIFLIMASLSKSAQFPFSAWLPAAMAAPTPISALVHSSTLVTAGVFLMIRSMSFIHPLSMSLILLCSFLTLFFSGLSANWEQDLKKIIALSTLSQIAIMFLAIAINSIYAAFSHLISHAFFKSAMFLCAGVLIHSSSYQDSRFQNSSSNFSPILVISFGICNMALLGLPFMSGFFSKDAIMESLMSSSINILIFFFSLLAIGMTASYSSRLTVFSLKLSSFQKKDTNFHIDYPLIFPIIILTSISIFLGSSLMWCLFPTQNFFLPIFMKISIFLTITSGMIIGYSLSFKSKKYNIMGESSISLWFLHFFSCLPFLNFISSGKQISSIDFSWMEMVSAQGAYHLLKSSSTFPLQFSSYLFISLSILTLTFMPSL